MQYMNIGQAATQGGVSAKMIRHYETIGLLKTVRRSAAGYRVYNNNDVHTLRFIRQARSLGFSMDQIRDLLGLWQNQRRTSRKVRELALNHIAELDERIRELQEIRHVLSHLVQHCHGDDRPDCPILESLANDHQADSTTKTLRSTSKRQLRNK